MARRGKRSGQADKIAKRPPAAKNQEDAAPAQALPEAYWKACRLAQGGSYKEARTAYSRLERSFAKKANPQLRALVQNDLAVLAAMQGKFDDACLGWLAALDGDGGCLPARLNLGLVQAEMSESPATADPPQIEAAPAQRARFIQPSARQGEG
jgi:hypothetical protein